MGPKLAKASERVKVSNDSNMLFYIHSSINKSEMEEEGNRLRELAPTGRTSTALADRDRFKHIPRGGYIFHKTGPATPCYINAVSEDGKTVYLEKEIQAGTEKQLTEL